MKSLQLKQSRRGLRLIWRIKNKKTNSSSSVGLTRISVVVVVGAEGDTLMAVADVGAEVVGTRMAVAAAPVDFRMAVVAAAGTTMIPGTTNRGTTTTEAAVAARVVAALTTTTMVEVCREAAMGILGGLSWVQTPSSLTVLLEWGRGAILLL